MRPQSTIDPGLRARSRYRLVLVMWRVKSHGGPAAPVKANGCNVSTIHGAVETSDLAARFITTETRALDGRHLYQVTIEMPRRCAVRFATGPEMPTKHLAMEHAAGTMMQQLVDAGEIDTGLRPKLAKVLQVRGYMQHRNKRISCARVRNRRPGSVSS